MKLRITMVRGRGSISVTGVGVNHRQLESFPTARKDLGKGETLDLDVQRMVPQTAAMSDLFIAFSQAPKAVQVKVVEVLEKMTEIPLASVKEYYRASEPETDATG